MQEASSQAAAYVQQGNLIRQVGAAAQLPGHDLEAGKYRRRMVLQKGAKCNSREKLRDGILHRDGGSGSRLVVDKGQLAKVLSGFAHGQDQLVSVGPLPADSDVSVGDDVKSIAAVTLGEDRLPSQIPALRKLLRQHLELRICELPEECDSAESSH